MHDEPIPTTSRSRVNAGRTPRVRRPIATVAAAVAALAAISPVAMGAPDDALAAVAKDASASTPDLDIVILHADDLQPDGIAALGNLRLHTPHLDRLVGRGTAFVNCYNQGGWHGAICVASRAMLLTGRHLWTCGGGSCGDWPLWPTAFGQAGWATFGTGKWHTGQATFERSFEFLGETGPGMLHSTPRDGVAYDRPVPDGTVDTWTADDRTLAGHWMERPDGRIVHSSAHWIDAAISFIDGHLAGGDPRPYLAYVSFHAPHDPRQAPTEDLERHPLEACDPPPNFVAVHPFDQGDARVRDEVLAPFPRTDAAARLHQREYWAIIDHLDRQIGRLLDHLDALGRLDRTLIVFIGDHGLAVGQHGLLGKQNLYEHSVKTPMVFAGPGVPEGRRIHDPVYLHTTFATVAALAGLEPDAVLPTAQAPSLTAYLRDEHGSVPATKAVSPAARAQEADVAIAAETPPPPLPPPGTLYAAYRPELQRMVRDGRHKLILYPKAQVVQLFDLATDPWETRNLAGDPAARPSIERLWSALQLWMDHVSDPLERSMIDAPWTWRAPALDAATAESAPDPAPTPEPAPDSESEPESESAPGPTSMPEPEVEPEPEPDPKSVSASVSEPTPDLDPLRVAPERSTTR